MPTIQHVFVAIAYRDYCLGPIWRPVAVALAATVLAGISALPYQFDTATFSYAFILIVSARLMLHDHTTVRLRLDYLR